MNERLPQENCPSLQAVANPQTPEDRSRWAYGLTRERMVQYAALIERKIGPTKSHQVRCSLSRLGWRPRDRGGPALEAKGSHQSPQRETFRAPADAASQK